MHTFKGAKTSFNYNSDLSGNVLIRDAESREIEIPGKDLLDFIGNYVRDYYIARLEIMETEEILGIKNGPRV